METVEKFSAKELEVMINSRQLLLANSIFNPQQLLQLNSITYWEEITCVGYNPAISRLEAVVSVKQPNGYSGGLCTTGSVEYVRFFVDWNHNGIYQELGLTSFRAHDISDAPPGQQHPLKYMVYLKIKDKYHRRFCKTPVLPKVRAVLSWNIPPSHNPFVAPHFGNAIEARIQLQPLTFFDQFPAIDKLLQVEKSATATVNQQLISNSLPVTTTPPALTELNERYKKLEVPRHRLMYQTIQPLLGGSNDFSALALQKDLANVKELNFNLAEISDILIKQKFDTTYEQITCVGLNTATDMLGAVIRINKPGGYNGGLCEAGSNEYVAFWADWNNNGTFDQYLGTTAVRVHDIPLVKKDHELYYAVSLPFNVKRHLKDCKFPNIIKIRAVLSWGTPPSATDPNAIAHWGNRADALVQIRPGVVGTDLVPLIEAISGVTLDTINTNPLSPAYGLGNSISILTESNFNTFGGTVYITGTFLNSGPSRNVKYKIEFDDGWGWQPVAASQTYLKEYPGTPPTYAYETQTPPDGWFEYIPDGSAVDVVNKTLASWNTGTKHGIHKLRILYTVDKVNIFTDEFSVIRINNTAFITSPTANTAVDPFSTFDLVIDGGDCHSYDKSSPIINGHVRVLHEVFGYWTLELEPATHTHGVIPTPTVRTVISLSDTGDANAAWSLDTSRLDKCGYTVTLRGYDRTIVNGSLSGRHASSKSVGFAVL